MDPLDPSELHLSGGRDGDELRKLERDVQIGREIQLGFLPSELPQPSGWELGAYFRAAREVAGDFYDAFELVNGRRLGFVIADVCDKGVGAALFMALFRTLIRSGARHTTSLGWVDGLGDDGKGDEWLTQNPAARRRSIPNVGTGALMNAVRGTNDYIAENHADQGYFATLFMGVLDPSNGALLYVNGGHNPPVLKRTDGTHEPLPPTGPAVGMFAGASFTIGEIRMNPGDVLFTYTDGVPDARAPSREFFGMERVERLLAETGGTARDHVGTFEAHLHDHIGTAAQYDDITMLALRRQTVEDTAAPSPA